MEVKENLIFNIILNYFDCEEGEDLFLFPAYELRFKYEVLFKELEKEIKFNLESPDVKENYKYLDLLKKLFKTYSEDSLKNSKYIVNYDTSIQQINIPYESISELLFPLTNLCAFTAKTEKIYSLQSGFIDAVKNHLLYELLKYINSIDLNSESIYNNLKLKKSSKNYSVDYLNYYCELLNSGTPFQAYTFNYYSINIFEHYSDMFKKEFEENCNNYKKNNDFNIDDYIETCLRNIKDSKSFEPENKSIFNYIDEDYFNRENFSNNDQLDEILSSHKYVYDDDPDNYNNEFISGYNDFYMILEADKMIEFITKQSSEISRIVPPVIPSIFAGQSGFDLFNLLLEKFGIDKSKAKKRGSQARFIAIWNCSASKSKIFNDNTQLNEYITYLNRFFSLNLNPSNLSKGDNHSITIENWLKEIK